MFKAFVSFKIIMTALRQGMENEILGPKFIFHTLTKSSHSHNSFFSKQPLNSCFDPIQRWSLYYQQSSFWCLSLALAPFLQCICSAK